MDETGACPKIRPHWIPFKMILRLLHEFATTKSWLNQPRAVGWPSSLLFLHGSRFYQFLRAQSPWSTAVGMAHPNRPQGIFLASGTPRIFEQSYPKFPRFQGVGFRNPSNSKNSPKQSGLWFIFFKNPRLHIWLAVFIHRYGMRIPIRGLNHQR